MSETDGLRQYVSVGAQLHIGNKQVPASRLLHRRLGDLAQAATLESNVRGDGDTRVGEDVAGRGCAR